MKSAMTPPTSPRPNGHDMSWPMRESRLIEHAFPLKQASLDSVHEKNVRHGHISTLHIWPAQRPLAACRVALIAKANPRFARVQDPFGNLLAKGSGSVVITMSKIIDVLEA
jgi:adenine-specific DNA methylase